MEPMLHASSSYQVGTQGSTDRARTTTPGGQNEDGHRARGESGSSDFTALGGKKNHSHSPLIPDKHSGSSVFVKGLTQGIVYGSILTALLLFFLVLLT